MSWSELLNAQWVSEALYVVARMGVADALEQGPLALGELAARIGADRLALGRVLRGLATVGLFSEQDAVVTLTDKGRRLCSGPSDSLRPLILTAGLERLAFGRLEDNVRTGRVAFDSMFGMGVFPYLAEHPEEQRIFDEGMASATRLNVRAIVDAYDFSPFATIVDIGGGRGTLLRAILDKHPEPRGVLFDRPVVIPRAREVLEACGLAGRCAYEPGDFFTSVPRGGDLYMMSSILHDWSDEQALRVLRSCHDAMGPEARLLIAEMVIPPREESSFASLLDLKMMVMTGGLERTEAEYRSLLEEAGFALTRTVPTRAMLSVLEATRV